MIWIAKQKQKCFFVTRATFLYFKLLGGSSHKKHSVLQKWRSSSNIFLAILTAISMPCSGGTKVRSWRRKWNFHNRGGSTLNATCPNPIIPLGQWSSMSPSLFLSFSYLSFWFRSCSVVLEPSSVESKIIMMMYVLFVNYKWSSRWSSQYFVMTNKISTGLQYLSIQYLPNTTDRNH